MNAMPSICKTNKPFLTPCLNPNQQNILNQTDSKIQNQQIRIPNLNNSFHVSRNQTQIMKFFQFINLTLEKIYLCCNNQYSDIVIQNIRYKVQKQIGQGSFGQVFLLKIENSNNYYALKVQKQMNKEEEKILLGLQGIKFKNLVNTIECLYNYMTQEYFILMEYCEYSLEDLLQKQKLNQQDARYIIKQIANGIKELHEKQIIHRDLKPENILVFSYIDGENTQKTYKICDFGLSSTKQISQTFKCGTSHYMAPEQIQCLSDKTIGYNASVDIWALGAVIYELFSGEVLFMGNSNEEIFRLILDFKQESLEEKITNKLGNLEHVSLVVQMMQIDPNKRIQINEVINQLKINGTRKIRSLHEFQPAYQLQKTLNFETSSNVQFNQQSKIIPTQLCKKIQTKPDSTILAQNIQKQLQKKIVLL